MSTTYRTKRLNGADRLSNWPERLSQFLIDNNDRPFEWGDFDCSQFAIHAEIAITGDSRFWDYKGGYKTKRGAFGKLKRGGFNNVWQLVDSRLERLDNVKLAQRGDVIGHRTGDGESLGICIGKKYAASGSNGIVYASLDEAVCAWRM